MNQNKIKCVKALFAIVPFAFLLGFDVTGVSVALTEVQKHFLAHYTSLQWVLSAYLVVYGGLSILPGRIGDSLGLRKVFIIGGFVFTAGAVCSAISPTIWYLIGGRILQGAGAAILAAVGVGIIARYFDVGFKAVGISSFLAAASSGTVLGPVIGGVLQDAFGWRGIFWGLACYSAFFFVLSFYLISPKFSERKNISLRIGDGLLLCTGIILFLVWLNEGQTWHWYSNSSFILLGISVILLIAFFALQLKRTDPIFDLKIFMNRNVIGSSIGVASCYFCYVTYFFFLPIFFIHVLGVPIKLVGLYYLPLTIMNVFSMITSNLYRKRFSTLKLVAVGFVVMLITNVNGAYLIAHGVSYTTFAINLGVFGFFSGLTINLVVHSYMKSIPKEHAGIAGGLLSGLRFVSSAVGIILFTLIFLQLGESDAKSLLIENGIKMTSSGIQKLDLFFSGIEGEKAFQASMVGQNFSLVLQQIKSSFSFGIADTLAVFTAPIVIGLVGFLTFYRDETRSVQ